MSRLLRTSFNQILLVILDELVINFEILFCINQPNKQTILVITQFMKVKFLVLAALVLGMASCVKEDVSYRPSGDEVNFSLTVSSPELAATRAGEDGKIDSQSGLDSAYGAIDYLQGGTSGDTYRYDWDDVNIRYSLEVYDKADSYTNATPVKDRMVIVVDKYEPVTFDLRLIPDREYRFVIFADFVPQSVTTDSDEHNATAQAELGLRHNIGNTLGNITVKGDALNDEVADAYFAYKDIKIDNSQPHSIVLKRPYAKLRVITTDLAELNINDDPAKLVVKYEAKHPNQFNAINGKINGEYTTNEYTVNYNDGVSKLDLANHTYTAGYDAEKVKSNAGVERHSHMTLMADYILATEGEHTPIHFEISAYSAGDKLIKTTKFDTEIPIERNHLTTIIGNVLTTNTSFNVSIDDNFANVDDDDTTNDYDFTLLETLMNGGEFTLTEDLTITEPTNLIGNAVINLNGYTLNYVASKEGNKHTIMTRVENGASLRFIGPGEVKSTGYIASANEGGKIFITEGKFTTENCTLFQANGGEVYISGGEFMANEYDGDYRYTLNHVDSKKNVGKIEVSGGRFFKYDPAKSNSENPAMNFVKFGFGTVKDGDWYVVEAVTDYIDKGDHMEVYSAKGLAKWAYVVNNVDGKKSYGVKLMTDITLPQYALVADALNETYMFDDAQPIDGTNSNWITVCSVINDYPDTFSGNVMGENHIISGLRINNAGNYAGFIGFMYDDASIKDLTFVDAKVNSTGTQVGVAAGRAQDGSLIDNVHVKSSEVSGSNSVGGIVGRNYSRVGGAMGQGFTEGPAIVRNCSTDAATKVNGSSDKVGGIVGYNYGATIVNCKNSADVTGNSSVGGIVGYTRDYHHNKDGYIVACITDANATITATNGCVAGIAGYTLADSQHTNTYMHIVACASFSEIVGAKNGCIIGVISHRQHTAGCVAVKNGTQNLYGSGAPTTENHIVDAILYDAANGATQADVDALNAAIAHYNSNNPPVEAQCGFTWTLDNGFVTLQ